MRTKLVALACTGLFFLLVVVPPVCAITPQTSDVHPTQSYCSAIAFVRGKISSIRYHVPSQWHIGAYNTVVTCKYVLVIAIAEVLFCSRIFFFWHGDELAIEEGTFYGTIGPTVVQGIWNTSVPGPI
jgi:hypothetical protein